MAGTRGDGMGAIDQADPQVIDSVVLMRAFLKIADPADRRKVIELAAALARAASPSTAPRCLRRWLFSLWFIALPFQCVRARARLGSKPRIRARFNLGLFPDPSTAFDFPGPPPLSYSTRDRRRWARGDGAQRTDVAFSVSEDIGNDRSIFTEGPLSRDPCGYLRLARRRLI
jgi:hypothetical protein